MLDSSKITSSGSSTFGFDKYNVSHIGPGHSGVSGNERADNLAYAGGDDIFCDPEQAVGLAKSKVKKLGIYVPALSATEGRCGLQRPQGFSWNYSKCVIVT